MALLLGFGGRAMIDGRDIPSGIKELLVIVITAGVVAEPAREALNRLTGGKKDGEGK